MALGNQELESRRVKLLTKLRKHGINTYDVTHLPYVDETSEELKDPRAVGKRIIILHASAHTAHNLADCKKIVSWLKEQNLWEDVSPNEKKLFLGKIKKESSLIDFSWKIEAAYTLAWTFGLVKELSPPSEQMADQQWDDFLEQTPGLFSKDDLQGFYGSLKFIDKWEIHLETLLNELATAYFRDLLFNGNEDKTDIDRMASFERHTALNWLRSFMGNDEWDDTDTST